MFKVISTWKNAPKWPGPHSSFPTTTDYLRRLGGLPENLEFGFTLISSLNPLYANFIETTSAEYAEDVSWITEVYVETNAQADILLDYFQNRVKAEINELGFDITVAIEEME